MLRNYKGKDFLGNGNWHFMWRSFFFSPLFQFTLFVSASDAMVKSKDVVQMVCPQKSPSQILQLTLYGMRRKATLAMKKYQSPTLDTTSMKRTDKSRISDFQLFACVLVVFQKGREKCCVIFCADSLKYTRTAILYPLCS